MTLIQFIVSIILSITSIGSILISIFVSDSMSSNQNTNINSRGPGYDQFVQAISNQIFEDILGISSKS